MVKQIDKEELQNLVSKGYSAYHIAKILGLGGDTIRRRILKYNISYTWTQDGQNNPSWKGGRRIDRDGYVLVYSPQHPNRRDCNCVAEHRLVLEKVLGRYLMPYEVVHHIDGNKLNNHPNNLELFVSNAEHLKKELKNRIPKWTPIGRANILKSHHQRGHSLSKPSLDFLKKHGLEYILYDSH